MSPSRGFLVRSRVLGIILAAVGVFAIVLAVLLPTVVVSGAKKTPLNLDSTTVATGPGELLDTATGEVNTVDITATRTVRADSENSDGTNYVVDAFLCVQKVTGPCKKNIQDPDLLSLSFDRVAANRVTAEAVNEKKYQEAINEDFDVKHKGLTYKFPFDTTKDGNYSMFNNDLKDKYKAKYEGEEKIMDLTVYKFVVDTGDQDYLVKGVAPGTYRDIKTVYVEPTTGVIVKGVQDQTQTLEDGTVALKVKLTFTDKTVQDQVDLADSSLSKLNIVGLYAPIGAGVLGIACLVGGFLILRRKPVVANEPSGDHYATE